MAAPLQQFRLHRRVPLAPAPCASNTSTCIAAAINHPGLYELKGSYGHHSRFQDSADDDARWRRAAAERARGLGHAPVHDQLVVPRRVRRAGRPGQREELARHAQRRRAAATRHLPRSRTPLSRAIFLLHARRLTDVLLLFFCAAAGRGAWAWSQWKAWRPAARPRSQGNSSVVCYLRWVLLGKQVQQG